MDEPNLSFTDSPYAQLQNAIAAKDVDFVNSILYEGSPFINIAHPESKDTELHLIITNDDPQKNWTSRFMALGSNVNAKNAAGDTPLHKLISSNVLYPPPKLLIKNGADMNIFNENGISPFQAALLSRGVIAIEMFYPEEYIHPGNYRYLVKGLLNEAKHLNLNISTSNYSTLLHFAAEFADIDMFNFLLSNTKYDINALNPEGETLLNYTILKRRDIEIVKALLDHGADINQRSGSNYTSANLGFTALHSAVFTKVSNIVKMLLTQGTDVNAQSIRGSPLHIVSEKMFWSAEKAKLLLDFHADINARNLLNQTPIQRACVGGCVEAVKFLLQNGADVQTKCYDFRSTLHYAVLGNNFDIVKLILDRGLDPNAKDMDQRTPIFYAANRNANSSSLASLNLLLEYGADINAADYRGDTALHRSCKFFYLQPAKALLELNANINVLNKMGLTPLERAIRSHRRYNRLTKLNKILEYLCAYIDLEMNESLSEEKLNIIKSDPLVRDVYSKYEREVNLMKNEKISSSSSTCYFDLLKYDDQRLAILARNKTVMRILATGEYRFKFPLYDSILYDCIMKAKIRRNLIGRNALILKKITKRNLPFFIIDMIFSSLSLKDLRNLVRAYQKA
ncbi:putative ankyrin repeat protein RF_0381 [Belonocnema kinseyi]|uniref:putative ankyrin repeat protein RF_0381 n=1 Tax=Belonocnema kinseyi TaxID=2817044 RepID=UPI00143D0472|nr:putative ankyrin repeat protein RF_0381 [Belonocnema kinseyi]XP_033219143.1 putative ankyrin repeat protein RF_0381 [Belonocnema kinseyi]XP_033219152.1 putative ankyrin repeat protein RF_0381 [Belonocnema kinseyi]